MLLSMGLSSIISNKIHYIWKQFFGKQYSLNNNGENHSIIQ